MIYAPGGNANAVAEHAIGLLLALARNTGIADRTVRAGDAYERGQFQGIELAGKTLAIVGLGRIGRRVARKAHALDMQVIAYDPYVDTAANDTPAKLVDSFDQLLAAAVNTSRGGVVDERALHNALHRGGLAGAALDVFEHEPLAAGHPLLNAPNTLFTPHLGGITSEAMSSVSRQVAHGVIDVLEGRPPDGVANPIVLDQGQRSADSESGRPQ